MNIRKVPMRMCVVTREKLPKKDLIRVVKTSDGKVVLDLCSKINGRGIYLKKEAKVFQKAKNNKVLDRCFETEIDPAIYEELNNIL